MAARTALGHLRECDRPATLGRGGPDGIAHQAAHGHHAGLAARPALDLGAQGSLPGRLKKTHWTTLYANILYATVHDCTP